jgi:hypothetical protein
MATMKRPRLNSVEALQDYCLRLTFQDGSVYTVSLADDFDKFPGLRPLNNAKAFSKAALVAGEGR